jgi:hypothetical protein
MREVLPAGGCNGESALRGRGGEVDAARFSKMEATEIKLCWQLDILN